MLGTKLTVWGPLEPRIIDTGTKNAYDTVGIDNTLLGGNKWSIRNMRAIC